MDLNVKHLATAAVTLAIMVVLVASVLIPVLSEAQKDAGDPITLENNSAITLRDAMPGDVLTCTRTVSADSVRTDVWALNGEEITRVSGGSVVWNSALISDGAYMQTHASDSSAMGIYYRTANLTTPTAAYIGANNTPGNTSIATWTFDNGEITYTDYSGASDSVPYTWAKVICPPGEGEYTAANPNGTGYVTDPSEIILCGAYTSGNNKTMYWQNGGELILSNPAYTGEANITSVLHEGTSDIYDVSVSVDVGGESFIPYRIYVPFEVTGHETSGASYTLIGVIPILILAGLVIGVVGSFIRNRD